jgi:signal transduction histidine kinase
MTMSHPRHIWTAFAACACLAVAAAGWVSIRALQADASEAAARDKAIVEENTRLALWRMDSLMAPLVAQETARPYFVYEAFYPADRAYGRMFNGGFGQDGLVLVPSPLMTGATPSVRLYFQIDPANRVTSPQVPTEDVRSVAAQYVVKANDVAAAKATLTECAELLDGPTFLALCPPVEPVGGGAVATPSPQQAALPQDGQVRATQNKALNDEEQWLRGQNEYQARARYVQGNNFDNAQVLNRQAAQLNDVSETAAKGDQNVLPPLTPGLLTQEAWPSANVQVSVMKPLWRSGKLMLARRVDIGGREYVQGCVLDWPAIASKLLANTADLLPNAKLLPHTAVPSESIDESREVRLLASLPVQLLPGLVPMTAAAWLTPMKLALFVGWAALIMAAGAVVALLQGVMSLSERRAAFVSAVTHELRTPLTTFRMYSEMLAQGMVRDEADKQRYLETLRIEADRLTHLVANVLAYARLERGRPGGRIESLSVDRLFDVATERLEDRSSQAGFTLTIDVPEEVGTLLVQADASIVEQILFNLVDNACKYAAAADDKMLTLSATLDGDVVVVRLCDHGPGISPRGQKLLFQPFRKSASDAAVTAPGVGLGLALSRRLARDMGGDLRHEPGPDGTCFALRIHRGQPVFSG